MQTNISCKASYPNEAKLDRNDLSEEEVQICINKV